MRILYFGGEHPRETSRHRFDALQRIGMDARILDPNIVLGAGSFTGRFHYATGYRFLQRRMNRWLDEVLPRPGDVDLVWVSSGELFGPVPLARLRALGAPVVLYNNDDPTGGRDGRRFDSLLAALPAYDLCIIRRDKSVAEYEALGARAVMPVLMTYDEVAHAPFADASEIDQRFIADVAFVGTWIRGEKRDAFLLALVASGLNISIWGNRWQKSPLWTHLEPYWRGANLHGRDYVAAVQGAKVCIGLISRLNRDQHTRRSVEIPFVGSVLCAERTGQHMAMYREGEEAVFWDDAAECARHCHGLLADPRRREAIGLAGARRIRTLHAGNEDLCRAVLERVKML